MTPNHSLMRPRIRGSAWFYVVSLSLVFLAGWWATEAHRVQQDTMVADVRLAALQAGRARDQQRPPALPADERKKWESLRAEMAFPWNSVFKAVELADDPDVDLQGFEPDKQAATIRLRGEAKDMPSLLRYIDNLSGQPISGFVHLVRHEPAIRERLKTIEFELQVGIRN